MPAHGYLTYLLRAGVNRKPEQLYRLNAIGQSDDDLLTLMHGHAGALGNRYHPMPKSAEGFRIKENAVRGRTLWLKVNRGPAGSPGETYDLDTDQSSPTTDRQAQLSELRALAVLPENSYLGLLFVERQGRRHLKDLVADVAIKPSGQSAAATIRVESFAQIADWERELSSMQVLRVSESLVRRDSGEDASTARDTLVTVSAEGGMLHRLSDRLKGTFTGRVRRRDEQLQAMVDLGPLAERRRQATADGVTFQDEEEFQAAAQAVRDLNVGGAPLEGDEEIEDVVDEVLAIDREQFKHKRFEFSLGEERPQRNIIIENSTIPQFIYELGGRLSDGALRNLWVDHAESILRDRGVELPVGWDR